MTRGGKRTSISTIPPRDVILILGSLSPLSEADGVGGVVGRTGRSAASVGIVMGWIPSLALYVVGRSVRRTGIFTGVRSVIRAPVTSRLCAEVVEGSREGFLSASSSIAGSAQPSSTSILLIAFLINRGDRRWSPRIDVARSLLMASGLSMSALSGRMMNVSTASNIAE